MSTKKDVLRLLEANREDSISGAAIAEQLCLSRTSVWKAVNDLRNEGYQIEGATNKGYSLSRSDILSEEGICAFLDQPERYHLHVFDCVGSTSDVAKELAAKGAPDNTVVIAETQTAGKGRRGRSFYSPSKSGIYVSVLIKPEDGWDTPETAVLLTTAASVATARAVEQVTGKKVSIKWVNDLYLGDKKICGILTEGITNLETGAIEAAVIGIGINLFAPEGGYPDELKDKAVSLLGDSKAAIQSEKALPERNHLIAAVLTEIHGIRTQLNEKSFIPEYKTRSCVIGRDIRILSPKGEEGAKALDISENGGLVVQTEDGTVKTLNSGEITIRFGDLP